MTNTRLGRYFVFALSVCLLSLSTVVAQQDVERKTVAITYPLDETVTVKFRGTTLLPRLKGEAKVKRAGRRGTRVELNIDDLPRASELGGIYTTYVLWAISPEGHVDNLGEIKRSGSSFVDSKLDVTTPLQTFALILTAEPHFLMKVPSRMVVMENLPPQRPNGSTVETVDVRYIGNSSDYFRTAQVPEIAGRDYRETPVSLLGARRAARKNREEIRRRDDAVRAAEQNADALERQVAQLRTALEKEQRARELAERDAGSANDQLREKRVEIARLRDENQALRAESDTAKLKLARLEGEKDAETARVEAERRAVERRNAEAALKETLAKYGTVRETGAGFRLILPETIWTNARKATLATAAAAKLEPLAALLASNPDYQILIEAYTDNKGNEVSLQQLTQERARVLSDRFQSAGVDPMRIQANGMGASNPLAPNTTVAGQRKNRRVEITFTSPLPKSTAAN